MPCCVFGFFWRAAKAFYGFTVWEEYFAHVAISIFCPCGVNVEYAKVSVNVVGGFVFSKCL
jgi:hypothetical protein